MTTRPAVLALVIAVLVVVALGSVGVTVVGLHRDPEPLTAADPPPAVGLRPEIGAAEVLASWDAERAAAWASGDVRRLRSLYTPGSVAGRRDAGMLRRWLQRGFVVRDLRTQVLALSEVSHSGDRWVLTVTDRVAGGVADARETHAHLPADMPTTRTVTMRRFGETWLVSAVR